MPLYSEAFAQNKQTVARRPTIVFLHGMLGSGADWHQVIDIVSHQYHCITIDLPGHGKSQSVRGISFEHTQDLLAATLSRLNIKQAIFVGYSLGARLLMDIASHLSANWPCQILALVLEGGNFGLLAAARSARWTRDQNWAQQFRQLPLDRVLSRWYRQAVFSSLSRQQRASLILRRNSNTGESVAEMLEATSLAKQPNLLPILQAATFPVRCLCGDKDIKFQHLARQSRLEFCVVNEAGHNVHLEQPELFSEQLLQFLKKMD